MINKMLVFVFLLAATLVFIFASCDNAVTPSVLGTWINSDYDGVGGKVIIAYVSGNDYTWTNYINHDDTEPDYTVDFTVTSETTDSEGNIIVKTLSYPGDPEVYYAYSMVHADNQTFETNSSEVDYPTEIDPGGEDYLIMYRP